MDGIIIHHSENRQIDTVSLRSDRKTTQSLVKKTKKTPAPFSVASRQETKPERKKEKQQRSSV